MPRQATADQSAAAVPEMANTKIDWDAYMSQILFGLLYVLNLGMVLLICLKTDVKWNLDSIFFRCPRHLLAQWSCLSEDERASFCTSIVTPLAEGI
ncbi:hypothetical protein BUALT_Bualt02G0232900 [Buddleja alternifolia]|uniref:Uncharacterized protein n=1 Tax=Buddleja alternifolia TaxID=168488 RepID=A0AAV6Y8P4_9LAMI|nr:hypothetical protein BUALT_Bualt02G0232900 [Buddleja alternifolia]